MTVKIPTKPHSQEGLVTTAVDADYLNVNLKAFDPYGAIYGGASQALWELVIYLAQTHGTSVKDEKEILANEITAGKIYPAILMSYLQALRAQKNIADLAPIFIINIATSDGIFTEDEWFNEMNMGNNGQYPSISGIEDLITRINPIWKIEDEYPLLNYPPSWYLQWVPNKTKAEMRALRVLLGTYAEAYQTFCNKCKISTSVLNVQSFVEREVPKFKPFEYGNKDWLFWNASGGYISIQNGANSARNYFTARRYPAGELMDVTIANWLTARDKYYIIPSDGEPSDLNAIIQMFYPYTAENLLGCAVPDDGGGINDDTLEAADVYGFQLSRSDPATTKDTAAVAIDRGALGRYFNAFPSMFASQAAAVSTLLKMTEEAGETATIYAEGMTGGLKLLNYDTNIWDNANGLLAQTFWQDLFGKGISGATRMTKKVKYRKKVEQAGVAR